VAKRFHALQGGGAAVLMIGLAVSPAAPLAYNRAQRSIFREPFLGHDHARSST